MTHTCNYDDRSTLQKTQVLIRFTALSYLRHVSLGSLNFFYGNHSRQNSKNIVL